MSDFPTLFQHLMGRPEIARSAISRRMVITRRLGIETVVVEDGQVVYRRTYPDDETALAGHRATCERLLDGDTRFLTRPRKKSLLGRIRAWWHD